MPTHVERTEKNSSDSETRPSRPALGARAVVELLNLNQPATVPQQFQVTDHRRPESLKKLIRLLTAFQKKIADSAYGSASVLSLLTKHLVETNEQLEIARPDLGAIHLVDSIFNALLSSGRFDKEAWGLVSRTRFPVTKFALQDFSFFFAPQNIGRRLLNTITLHLLGSAEQRKGEVRTSISLFVDRLNLEYDDHISQFNSVCIETQSYFASHQRRLTRIETKISQVEGPDSKKDRSEPIIIETLNAEVGGRELPDMIVDFIYGEWRNSMRLVLLQEGENSPNWKRQVSLTQSMVQIHEACQSEEGRAQYSRFWPSMFKGIKGLLISVEQDSSALENAIDPLELVCAAMIRGAEPDLKKAPQLQAQSVVNDSFEVIKVDEEYLAQVEALNVGEWIRIKTPSQDYEACKLTVKTTDAEPWVFVNNTGSKIAKKSKYALAKGLRDGVVDIVGQGQWIDDLLRDAFTRLARLLDMEKRYQQTTPEPARKETTTPETSTSEAATQVATTSESLPDRDAPLPQPEVEEITGAETDEEPEAEAPPEPAPAAEPADTTSISLVSREEQESSYHVKDAAVVARTDEILSGSTLSMVNDDLEEAAGTSAEESGDQAWEDYFQEEASLSEAELEAASRAVEALEVGAQVNYLIDGRDERCKLAVKMLAKDKFIFVNRVGVKVWDTSQQEVVEAVAKGLVTIIDSGVKFDRALERVVKNIQSGKKGREW